MPNKEDCNNILFHFVAILFVLSCLQALNAQHDDETTRARRYLDERGEVIIRFRLPYSLPMNELTHHLSIDNKKGDSLTAYAGDEQFSWFLDQQIPFKVIPPRKTTNASGQSKKSTAQSWDFYPAYPAYLQMMESFATGYPEQCILKELGTSVNGRKLLAVKISDNPAQEEAEPVFLYTSTIHGDEGTGYVLLLRLIDSLLTAYDSNHAIQQLVDNTEIWINPLANPDGFYFDSDTFFFHSKRFNLNNIDLNRNFPDALAGDHPDGHDWQPETIAMMDFMKQQQIVLAANLHDGAELVNYPWDCRYARHADDIWYQAISRQFADTVQRYGPAGIFRDEDNGITNGYDWYSIYGSRQDYVNYFLHGREVTLELSHEKSPDPAELLAFWDYYRKSLIGYMLHIHTGVHGTVLDADNGESLKAMIDIPGYDRDSSQVFSSPETGEFYRLLPPGSYTFRVASPGYFPQKTAFNLSAGETKKMTISLLPANLEFSYFPNPFTHSLTFLFPDDSIHGLELTLSDISGRIIRRETWPEIQGSATITGLERLARGTYLVRLSYGRLIKEIKVIK